jgi:hypothetical protein
MSRGKSSYGPLEFTTAARDEVRINEHGANVAWETSLAPHDRRGIWIVSTKVYDRRTEADPVPVVRYASEWPNSRAQSFEAHLYTHCHVVARMVEEWTLVWASEEARARGA